MVDRELRRSPLEALHEELGARMGEFGGWRVPMDYGSVVEEHVSCRSGSVVFDVSHLGTVRVPPEGFGVLQRAFTNDLSRIEPGRAQYTHLLDSDDAHVVDDLIVWWTPGGDLLVMPNAAHTDRLRVALAGIDADLVAPDVTETRAVLAVQGPEIRDRLAEVAAPLGAVRRFDVAEVMFREWPCVVAGTGYTGEDGVEIQIASAGAAELWQALTDAGVRPAGLGARDTLRLEAGFPLHGHELGPGITPLQARLGWVVAWDKGEFLGREPLAAERERGVHRRLVGLRCDGRRPARAGCEVQIDGLVCGTVTSGNFSPTLGHAIALAFVAPDVAEGTEVDIDVRGRSVMGVVSAPRFLTS